MCHSHSKLRKGFQGGYIFSKIHIFTWLFPLPSSGQLLSCVRLFETPWTAACQASLSIASSWSLLKFMSIESVMPSNHLILCCPLLLLPSIFPSIRVFSNKLPLCIRWPKYPKRQKSSVETAPVLGCCSSWDLRGVLPYPKIPGQRWIVANFSRPFHGQSHTLGPFHLSSSASTPSQLQVNLQPYWLSC